MRRRRRQADIKSNNPHLTGGEKKDGLIMINHSILFLSHDFPCSLCDWSKGTADPTTWCSTTTPRAAVAALWPALWGCANSSPTSRAGAIRQDLHCRNTRSGVH